MPRGKAKKNSSNSDSLTKKYTTQSKGSWDNFRTKAATGKPPHTLLALDPGETTGFSVFHDGSFSECGQIESSSISEAMQEIHWKIRFYRPDVIVCEDYRIYANKRDIHVGSNVPVIQLIGAIRLSALMCPGEPQVVFQSAAEAKGFCDNGKLKAWGLYQTAYRHANDAIRHACFHLLFRKGE